MTLDFQINKKFCDEVALIPSKNLRNKIAGYVTHLTKRVYKKSLRGVQFKISEKLCNKESEAKLSEYIRNVQTVEIDGETYKMLEKNIQNVASFQDKFKELK